MSMSWRYVFSSWKPARVVHPLAQNLDGRLRVLLFAGMFRSSTKTNAVEPSGGPSTPLRRLSSFESMMSCVWFEPVCAEKLA